MADHHAPVTISTEALLEAKTMWNRVTAVATYSIVGICGVLVLMALFLV